MVITSTFAHADQAVPLYCKYQGQLNAQPAFIELSPEDGTVTADYSGEIVGEVPEAVWHGRIRRYTVPATLKGNAVPVLIEQLMPFFERVSSGYTCEWDGDNMVGKLTEDAMSAEKAIEQNCESIDPELLADVYERPEELLDDYFDGDSLGDIWPSGRTLDEAVDEQMESAMHEGFALLFDAEDLRRYFLRKVTELADAGRALSSEQCAALLADGYEYHAVEDIPTRLKPTA